METFMRRRHYTRIALLCSVPTWVIARDQGQRQREQDLGFATAFGKVYGGKAA